MVVWSLILFAPVLLVAHMLEPVHDLPIQAFVNGNVGHCSGRAGPMPVLLAGRKPDHITGPNLLERPTPTLCEAATRRDDQRLAQWVRVPGCASSRLEGDARSESPRWMVGLKQRINPYRSSEPIGRAFARGLGSVSFDFHDLSVFDLRLFAHSGFHQT
jgi:hypothetical protein